MDKWLGSGAKLLENLAQAPAEAPKVSKDGRKELRFGQGQLGFTLECMHVVSVTKESQAARHGVEIGDRLTKVDGRPVPEFEPDDSEGEHHAHEQVMKWLEDMPRPAIISFLSPEPGDLADTSSFECGDGNRRSPSPDETEPNPTIIDVDPEATQAHTGTMETGSRREGFVLDEDTLEQLLSSADPSLVAEVKRQRAANVQMGEDLREQQRKTAGLWKQLAVLKAENKQVLLVQSRAQEESFDAMEVSQKREQAFKEEIAQLQQSIEAGKSSAAETAAKESAMKVAAAEGRAAAAEALVETLRRQVGGFHAEHETEVRLLREKQDKWEKDACDRFAEQESKHKEREAESAKLLERAKKESSGFDDFAVDIPTRLPTHSQGESSEVAALYDRIALLQKRNALMQKKLSAASASSAGLPSGFQMTAPRWSHRLVSLVGLRAGEPILRFYTTMNGAMLRITHKLLKSEFWRWVFYVHVALMYMVFASWYAQSVTEPLEGSPTEALNAGIAKAASANAEAAKVASANNR